MEYLWIECETQFDETSVDWKSSHKPDPCCPCNPWLYSRCGPIFVEKPTDAVLQSALQDVDNRGAFKSIQLSREHSPARLTTAEVSMVVVRRVRFLPPRSHNVRGRRDRT